jgi:uncharacterized ion transporter superfamily protein YfcC
VAIPRGVIDAAEVVMVVLFVGGAFALVEQMGTLRRGVDALVGRFHARGLWAIPMVTLPFYCLGALENMQEEIIPLVPALLVLGRGLGLNAVTVMSMSLGGAVIGSAFSPINPFQAGIALRLAQLPLLAGSGLRLAMLAVAFVLWVGWTMRYARRTKGENPAREEAAPMGAAAAGVQEAAGLTKRDVGILGCVIVPLALYIYGVLQLNFGFNELSGLFFVAAFAVGMIGGLGVGGTVVAYFTGMQALLPPALLIGLARSISLVLADGHVIDTIVQALSAPLAATSPTVTALLMVPFHALVHIPVSSVSGQATLTMPLLVPLSDLVGLTRQATVLAFQTGAGLAEILTPTNGAMMAILLAAGVPFSRWIWFAARGATLMLLVGIAGILLAIGLRI